jgi:hypothetical protein
MLASISGKQFAEWNAYYILEPFGDEWLRTAMLASLIANANRDADLKPEPFLLQDFMPSWDTGLEQVEDGEDHWKRTKELFRILMEKHNG